MATKGYKHSPTEVLINQIKSGNSEQVHTKIGGLRSVYGEALANVLNQQDQNGETALTAACQLKPSKEKSAIVTALLAANANPQTRDTQEKTPAMHAAIAGDTDTLDLLHKAKTSQEEKSVGVAIFMDKDSEGLTPLIHAVKSDSAKTTVPHILDYYQQPSEEKSQSAGLGLEATSTPTPAQNTELVKMLNLSDKTNRTALTHSVELGKTEITESFLRAGADINQNWVGYGFESPLVATAMQKDAALMQLFVDQGANVDQVGFNGFTALMAAIRKTQIMNIVILLNAKPDFTKQDKNGNNALHWLLIEKAGYLRGRAYKVAIDFLGQVAILVPRLTTDIFTKKNSKGETALTLLNEVLVKEDTDDAKFFADMVKIFCDAKLKNTELLEKFMAIAVSKLYLEAARLLINAGCKSPKITEIPVSRQTGQVMFVKFRDLISSVKPSNEVKNEFKETELSDNDKGIIRRIVGTITYTKKTLVADSKEVGQRTRTYSVLPKSITKSAKITPAESKETTALKAILYGPNTQREKMEAIVAFMANTKTLANTDQKSLFQAAMMVLDFEVNDTSLESERESKTYKLPTNSLKIIAALKEKAANVFTEKDDDIGGFLHHIAQGTNKRAALALVNAIDLAPMTLVTMKNAKDKTPIEVCRYGEVLLALKNKIGSADMMDMAFYLYKQIPEQDPARFNTRGLILRKMISLLNEKDGDEHYVHVIHAGYEAIKYTYFSSEFNNILKELESSLKNATTLAEQRTRLGQSFIYLDQYRGAYPDFERAFGLTQEQKTDASLKSAHHITLPPANTNVPSSDDVVYYRSVHSGGRKLLQSAGASRDTAVIPDATQRLESIAEEKQPAPQQQGQEPQQQRRPSQSTPSANQSGKFRTVSTQYAALTAGPVTANGAATLAAGVTTNGATTLPAGATTNRNVP